jgi:3-polyprenyl-4-hydroxybenzoate decarboxylase
MTHERTDYHWYYGASGVIYGIEILRDVKKKDLETHLIISGAGKKHFI